MKIFPHGILLPTVRSRGGVHVPYHKNTADMPAVRMPAPELVVLPMAQSIGAPCEPLVQKGDKVKIGQKIGDTEKFVSAPVHASISGTVTAVGDVRLANGMVCTGVTIESDGEMALWEGIEPPKIETKDDFLAAVRASGVVGLGGAGFPTHVKLNVPKDKTVDTLIVNAAECEPYITVDYREALDNSWDVLSGVYALQELMGVKQVIIAVEDNKPQALRVLKSIADKDNAHGDAVKLMALRSQYPQGAEKMIVYSATGRKVPPGKLPADAGCIVINIATAAFIARYLKTGKPLVSRSLTVDGTAIRHPQNLRVPIGTRLRDIVDFCGGFLAEPQEILFGGPMMGVSIYDLDAPLCKQNNALLAFTKAHIKKETACINCGRCAAACPMSLTPTFIKNAALQKDTGALKKLGAPVCMECGCCAYSCPAGQPLVQYLRLAKQLLREEKN